MLNFIKSVLVLLFSQGLYRLGVINERYFPNDRTWPLDGEGIYWIGWILLSLALFLVSMMNVQE